MLMFAVRNVERLVQAWLDSWEAWLRKLGLLTLGLLKHERLEAGSLALEIMELEA